MAGNGDDSALEIWNEKLEDFKRAEALASDQAQKFQLKKQIEECQQKIQELEEIKQGVEWVKEKLEDNQDISSSQLDNEQVLDLIKKHPEIIEQLCKIILDYLAKKNICLDFSEDKEEVWIRRLLEERLVEELPKSFNNVPKLFHKLIYEKYYKTIYQEDNGKISNIDKKTLAWVKQQLQLQNQEIREIQKKVKKNLKERKEQVDQQIKNKKKYEKEVQKFSKKTRKSIFNDKGEIDTSTIEGKKLKRYQRTLGVCNENAKLIQQKVYKSRPQNAFQEIIDQLDWVLDLPRGNKYIFLGVVTFLSIIIFVWVMSLININILQTSEMTKLTKTLEDKQWKKANEITNNLLLDTTGRIYTPNYEKLSCDLLKKLDDVFMEGSDGKFGFSVQRDIWNENLKTVNEKRKEETESDFSNENTLFMKFATKVGWADEKTQNYKLDTTVIDELNSLESSSPKRQGRLPFWNYYQGTPDRISYDSSKLFKRINDCIPKLED
ncbi:MAG: GUN4 domain-containing protein [Crocosphaera sp.]|nr:GUN4 domain-containing protein [Crocosphaera sp.]